MDDITIARWRLHSQLLGDRVAAGPTEVVDHLLAVQAENHSQAAWAVATRTQQMSRSEFDHAFDTGELLRLHVLRPTWHLVRPTDVGWLVELTAPRVRRQLRSQHRDLGIDDGTIARAVDAIGTAIAGRRQLTSDELGAELSRRRLPGEGRPLRALLMHAELEGIACSGARTSDGEHTYASVDDRAPHRRRLARTEALAELALRYFTGHGPATERDLAYWATLPLGDVRAGIAAVADRLDAFDHDGRRFLSATPPPPAPPPPRAHLLQILDEYFRGYQDSRWTLDVAGRVARDRIQNTGMALHDGQMIGDLRRTVTDRAVRFDVTALSPLTDTERAALDAAGRRYGAFLDRRAAVHVTDAH